MSGQTRTRYIAGAGGGGGGGDAEVEWGPNFGEGQELTVGASISMAIGPLEGFQTVGAHITMPDLDIVYRNDILTTGCHAFLPDLALVGSTDNVGCHISLANVELGGALAAGVGSRITMPTMAMAHTKTVGGHISGTALGAPFWQNVTTKNVADGGNQSITVNVPAGTQDGDLLLLIVGNKTDLVGDANFNTPAGWNLIFHTDQSQMNLASFWRIASSEPASYTVTTVTGPNDWVGEMHRITGTHATTPLDASAEASLAAAAVDPDPSAPAVTTVAANCLVFAVLLHDHASLAQTHTPPASHAERTDFEGVGASTRIGLTTATRVFATPGSQAAVEFNCTETVATDACMQRISIAPGTIVLAS
jgi:hypothetical protein